MTKRDQDMGTTTGTLRHSKPSAMMSGSVKHKVLKVLPRCWCGVVWRAVGCGICVWRVPLWHSL